MDSKPRYVYDKDNNKLLYDVPYSDKGSLVLEVSEAPDGVKIGEKQKKVKQKNNKSEIQKLKEKVKKLNDKLADAQIENQRLERYIKHIEDSESMEIVELKTFVMSKGLWGNFIKTRDAHHFRLLVEFDYDFAKHSDYEIFIDKLIACKKDANKVTNLMEAFARGYCDVYNYNSCQYIVSEMRLLEHNIDVITNMIKD